MKNYFMVESKRQLISALIVADGNSFDTIIYFGRSKFSLTIFAYGSTAKWINKVKKMKSKSLFYQNW